MKQILSVFLLISLLFSSCSTEFDVIDEWKDITVVYCLLNHNDTVHYAKIEKAFLGQADAYDMAQISDSLYYESLDVTLEEYGYGDNILNVYELEKTTEIPKDSGIFADDNNVLYKLNTKLNYTYGNTFKLVVYNSETDKTVYGETQLISGLKLDVPSKIPMTNFDYPYKLEFKTCQNARIYDLSVKFYYFEKNLNTGDTTHFVVDWNVGSKISISALGGEDMLIKLLPASFLNTLATKIPNKEEDIVRVVNKKAIDIILRIGGTDLYTYMEVNGPSFGLIQEKPEYTNIVNGVGLISTLYDKSALNREISSRSVDSVAHSIYTSHLEFEDYGSIYYQSQP